MGNLLSAGMYRLLRSKVFYVAIVASVLLEIWIISVNRQGSNEEMGLENQGFFSFGMFLPLVLSTFCGLFLGADHANGTLRNQLIAGHSKAKVYLANLLLSAGVGLCCYGASIVSGLLLGLGTGSTFQFDRLEMVTYFLGLLGMTLGAVSLTTLIANLFTSRSVGIVASLLLAIGMLFFAGNLSNTMTQPATIPQFTRFEQVINGNTIVGYEPDPHLPEVPNPAYPQGMWRVFLVFLWNWLPACQGIQFSEAIVTTENLLPLLGYMAVFIAFTTAIGLVVFQRKDVK